VAQQSPTPRRCPDRLVLYKGTSVIAIATIGGARRQDTRSRRKEVRFAVDGGGSSVAYNHTLLKRITEFCHTERIVCGNIGEKEDIMEHSISNEALRCTYGNTVSLKKFA